MRACFSSLSARIYLLQSCHVPILRFRGLCVGLFAVAVSSGVGAILWSGMCVCCLLFVIAAIYLVLGTILQRVVSSGSCSKGRCSWYSRGY